MVVVKEKACMRISRVLNPPVTTSSRTLYSQGAAYRRAELEWVHGFQKIRPDFGVMGRRVKGIRNSISLIPPPTRAIWFRCPFVVCGRPLLWHWGKPFRSAQLIKAIISRGFLSCWVQKNRTHPAKNLPSLH